MTSGGTKPGLVYALGRRVSTGRPYDQKKKKNKEMNKLLIKQDFVISTPITQLGGGGK
jgi:hypothetical protein